MEKWKQKNDILEDSYSETISDKNSSDNYSEKIISPRRIKHLAELERIQRINRIEHYLTLEEQKKEIEELNRSQESKRIQQAMELEKVRAQLKLQELIQNIESEKAILENNVEKRYYNGFSFEDIIKSAFENIEGDTLTSNISLPGLTEEENLNLIETLNDVEKIKDLLYTTIPDKTSHASTFLEKQNKMEDPQAWLDKVVGVDMKPYQILKAETEEGEEIYYPEVALVDLTINPSLDTIKGKVANHLNSMPFYYEIMGKESFPIVLIMDDEKFLQDDSEINLKNNKYKISNFISEYLTKILDKDPNERPAYIRFSELKKVYQNDLDTYVDENNPDNSWYNREKNVQNYLMKLDEIESDIKLKNNYKDDKEFLEKEFEGDTKKRIFFRKSALQKIKNGDSNQDILNLLPKNLNLYKPIKRTPPNPDTPQNLNLIKPIKRVSN